MSKNKTNWKSLKIHEEMPDKLAKKIRKRGKKALEEEERKRKEKLRKQRK